MGNVLEITTLHKKFKEFSLADISFTIPQGYIMGFIGPNGAGKTTTLKLILGMLKRDSGEILVFGLDNVANERAIKERIGVVMDQPYYVDEWTLSDVEKALAPFYRQWDTHKYKSLLSDLSLNYKQKVKELSRGMKMKLQIATALSHNADFLILDEPTSGLDAVARNELTDILSAFITEDSKSVLISTHITTDLEKIADFITFINTGSISYTGTKDALMEKYLLVKGKLDILTPEQRNCIIGYREHSVGFDGLLDTAQLPLMPKTIVAEPCGLDEIVVRFNTGGNKV